ncbi:MAG: ABC transporter ATP-binding protein [Candidatus Paceibacterota bacterium]|nr:MAG: ABC transporter ATP-binding protein [Candidatus Paceibacterota bacterium]
MNNKNISVKLIFKYYWPHIKRYKKTVILTFALFGSAVVLTDIFSPLLYKKIMDLVSLGEVSEELSRSLIMTILMLGGVIFLYSTLFRLADYSIAYSQSKAAKDLADDAFARVSRHSYHFFSSNFSGSLVAKIRRYLRAFEEIYDQIIFTIWMKGLGLVFAFAVLTYFSPMLGIIFLIWFTLFVAISIPFIRIKIKKDILTAEADSRVTARLSDVITNILNVKIFSASEKEILSFAETTADEEKKRRDAWYFQNLQFLFQGLFIGIFEFVGMFSVIYLWINGMVSAGTIILMQIYIIAAFNITWTLGRNFTRIMRSLAEAKEMIEIFEEPLEVRDPIQPEKCLISNGKIEIKNISFYYNKKVDEKSTRNPVFKNFSLNVEPGEKVGLVGPSGAGKSTITKIILRFADIESGEVLIDGQNISSITQDDLRTKIAYVPQEPILFHRTLKENISYSKTDATEEEIQESAKKSHADEFINKFPKGYNTYVGERGVKLSGGERQRVAIARAMLKDAPILILDEATSSLDSISEKYIQDAFDKLMKNRTTIVIAHRLSTIQKMDRIVVMENGEIVEQGKHKELLSKNGLYYRLWKQQSHGFVGE